MCSGSEEIISREEIKIAKIFIKKCSIREIQIKAH